MYINVANNFYDFPKLLQKLSCEIISLLNSSFVKLLERFKILAAILTLEVLQVYLSNSSTFENKQVSISFTANFNAK